MKTALITTTINVPRVLALYRRYGPDVRFFVAIDKKTPEAAVNFCAHDLDNTQICYIQDQQQWSCSELIGWNCIQRRNIALLEAIKWGADVIVSIDDDNIPLNPTYFMYFQHLLRPDLLIIPQPDFNGLRARGEGWFDVGQFLDPVAPHRGIPHDADLEFFSLEPVVDAKVGVAAGICLGDPDISAVTRMSRGPIVHRVSEVLRSGVVVAPGYGFRTVFNSQNTAFIRELAPAFFMFPGCGRYDDIYASLVMQRVMRERNLHVHFGQPFVWQQRNQHDLVKDLRAEIDGMQHVEQFVAVLDNTNLTGIATVPNQVRAILHNLRNEPWFPAQAIEAGLAFQDDIEKIL